jgi:hypothetical protein
MTHRHGALARIERPRRLPHVAKTGVCASSWTEQVPATGADDPPVEVVRLMEPTERVKHFALPDD